MFKKNIFSHGCLLIGLLFFVESVHALSLAEVILAAEKNDPTLKSALENRDAATENIAIARSKLLPQVGFQGSYNKADQTITRTSTTQSRVNSLNSQLYLKQPLFRMRDWAGLSIGELQADYGFSKLSAVQSDLWLRVTNVSIDLISARELLDAASKTLLSVQHAEVQAKKRYKAGDGTKDAVAEAVAQLQLAKAQHEEANNNYKTKQSLFRRLTASNPTEFSAYKLEKLLKVGSIVSLDSFKEKVLRLNPEIVSSKLLAEINQKKLRQAEYDHLPTIDFVASNTNATNDTINTIGSKYKTYQYGVQISVPIFSGGGVSATASQAAYLYSAALSDVRATEYKIEDQIDVDGVAQDSYLERIKASKELVFAAREQVRANTLGLKNGIKTWADVAQAELNLYRRENDYLSYMTTFLKTQVKLLALLPVGEPEWSGWINNFSN